MAYQHSIRRTYTQRRNRKSYLKESVSKTPLRVATALPQTKELKQKKIGERFMEYLQDNGLKHAAYQNEDGNVKVIGLNKEQVIEALKKIVGKYKNKVNEGTKLTPYKVYNINGVSYIYHGTNSVGSHVFRSGARSLVLEPSKLNQVRSEGFPGGAGVGLSLPGGYINGAPSSDDVKKTRKTLGESTTEPKVITALRDVLKTGAKIIKDPRTGKNMRVDSFTASAIVQVYDSIKNSDTKEKYASTGLLKMQSMAFKYVK